MKLNVILTVLAWFHGDARLQVRDVTDPEVMVDSKVIDGPDCGHVKQIFGKWNKAKRAGGLAGAAKGTVNAATSAEDFITNKLLPTAESIGEEIGDDGKIPASIQSLVDAAKTTVEDVAAAIIELETSLSGFEQTLGESDFSAEKVTAGQMATLKEKTQKAKQAIREAYAAGEKAVSMAKEVKKKALKNVGKALTIIKSTMKTSKPVVDEAKAVAQKSGYLIDEAERTVGKAKDVKDRVNQQAGEAGDQEPVYDALAANIGDQSSSVDDIKDSLSKAVTDMQTVAGELGEQVIKLTDASEKGMAGDQGAVAAGAAEVPKTESKIDQASTSLITVKGRAKSLMGQISRLNELMKSAEKKLA